MDRRGLRHRRNPRARGLDDQEGEQATKTLAGTRTVPLAGRLRAELARHKLATGRGETDLCFGRTGSSAFIRSTVRSRANRAWQAAGLEPLTPHQPRHCAASYMAACGLTPKEAQTALGHADIRTTMNVYAKAVPGWEQGARRSSTRTSARKSCESPAPSRAVLSGPPAV